MTIGEGNNPEIADAEICVERQRNRFSIIWLLPLTVLAIGLWIAYESYQDRGQPIDIYFQSGEGITAGKTQLKYHGVIIGMVDQVRLAKDRRQVRVTVILNREDKDFAVEGSRFWLVKPEVSLKGVANLGTIMSGQFITVIPGKGKPQKEFVALEDSPYQKRTGEKDVHFVLLADRLGSLKPGVPVLFRQVKVGEVESARLSDTADKVAVSINIMRQYAPLVRQNSMFWNASGIGADLSIFGGKIKTESLETIFAGGVSFATPSEEMGKRVRAGHRFTLYPEPKDEWLTWSPKIKLAASHKKVQAAQKKAKPASKKSVKSAKKTKEPASKAAKPASKKAKPPAKKVKPASNAKMNDGRRAFSVDGVGGEQ